MSESEKARESGSKSASGSNSNSNSTGGEGAVTKPKKTAGRKAAPRGKKALGPRPRRSKQLPPFNVVLLDDDDHTVDYVVEMLRKIFGYPPERSMQMVKEIDQSGRVIVFTTHKEHAELKRDQIHAYGADFRLENSGGSMSAVIEPAK